MHTSLAHVEKSGTHPLRWEEGENGNIRTYVYQPKHMHTNVLGDVAMRCLHPVTFHVFPIVKKRENRVVMSKDHRQCTHHWSMWK